MWLYRNDKVFDDKVSSLMQVIYQCTALPHSWLSLQRLEDCDLFMDVFTRLEETAKKFITQYRWMHNRRILPPMAFSDA
jgi:hypothetical protein